jgi:hypothetical protein
MRLSRTVLALAILSEFSGVLSWQANSLQQHQRQRISLGVASQDVDEVKTVEEDASVSYILSRGDGSTGGGGLPMPKSKGDDDGLKRPKVGAEMPQG